MNGYNFRVGDLVGFAEEDRLIGVVTNVGNMCTVMDEIGRAAKYPKICLEYKGTNIGCAVGAMLDEVALFMSSYEGGEHESIG